MRHIKYPVSAISMCASQIAQQRATDIHLYYSSVYGGFSHELHEPYFTFEKYYPELYKKKDFSSAFRLR